jgi:glycosyltransferase involved in cell wall biosynthesis
MADKALHIVQVGFDDSVFRSGEPSDTLQRQLFYGEELARQKPGSVLTLLITTSDFRARRFKQGNVQFIPVRWRRQREMWKVFPALARLHRQKPIHVLATQNIYLQAWVVLLWGKLHRVPVVGQIHHNLFAKEAQENEIGQGKLGRLYFWLSLRLLKHFASVRPGGRKIAERIKREGWHQSPQWVPVPATVDDAVDENAEADVSTHNVEKRVLFAGRLVPQKNLHGWLRVAKLVLEQEPDATFEILGDGPLLDELKQETQKLGIAEQVLFSPAVPYDKLPDVYRASKVFLLTSFYEGLPRVAFLAYVNGTPIVATDTAGVEDLVQNGETGFLHDLQDEVGMAQSVVTLLRDEKLRFTMAQAGCGIVLSEYSLEPVAQRWMRLLVEVAEGTYSVKRN